MFNSNFKSAKGAYQGFYGNIKKDKFQVFEKKMQNTKKNKLLILISKAPGVLIRENTISYIVMKSSIKKRKLQFDWY